VKTPVPNEEEMVRIGRAYRRLAALNKVNQVMASNFDLERRLAAMLDTVLEVLEAQRGFVLLRAADGRTLEVKVAREMGRELEASSPSMGIAGRAAIDGEAVLMADRESNREFGTRDSVIRTGIVSAMCVPLRIEDRILGSVYLDTNVRNHRFSEEDLELFSSLASQAALAIDNARLHSEILEAEHRRESLARFLPNALVNKIINDSQSLELGGQKALVTTISATSGLLQAGRAACAAGPRGAAQRAFHGDDGDRLQVPGHPGQVHRRRDHGGFRRALPHGRRALPRGVLRPGNADPQPRAQPGALRGAQAPVPSGHGH
jgi:transcriptional regulator with GAF, ATPase, and Fis domain